MATTRPLTSHAAAAKMIRATLKAAFPTVAFTVRSRSFAGGDAVDVRWTDGPTSDAVDALIGQHEYGHFDGSIDLYEYSNVREDIPQVRHVQTRRDMSDDTQRAIVDWLNRYWGYELRLIEREERGRRWLEIDPATDHHTGAGWQSQEIWRQFVHQSLLCSACGAATLPGDSYCPQCGHALLTDLARAEDAA